MLHGRITVTFVTGETFSLDDGGIPPPRSALKILKTKGRQEEAPPKIFKTLELKAKS
jgi:hypothetical protein